MMQLPELDSIRSTVQTAIDQGRLGEPRFLRCIANTKSADEIKGSMAKLKSLGESWFGSPVDESHRIGNDSSIYMSVMLKWNGGQCALVSVTAVPNISFPNFDLRLIGSRGTLYHEI